MSWQRGWGEERPVGMAGLVYDAQRRRARRRAANLFGLGFLVGALASCGAGVAFGETITIGGVWLNGTESTGTTLTIKPSDKPGELAVVTLVNRYVNDDNDDGEYFIGIPGLVVGAVFEWDASSLGADKITVVPPEGLICIPADCAMTVMEGFEGSVVILDWIGS